MIYELRTYHCLPGKLPDLLARFRDLTLGLWERHQIRQVGFWTVLVGENSNDLIYMLAWDSMTDREDRWGKFAADPDWIRGRAASEEDGPIVASVTNALLRATDFSAIQG
jgi:hypothetical protein